MSDSTELAVQQGGEVGATQEQMYGNEVAAMIHSAMEANTGAGEVQFSRIAIAQPGTPEVAKGEPGYKVGQFLDSLSREILTSRLKQPWMQEKGVPEDELSMVDCMQVVPVFKLPSEFIKWKDIDSEGRGFHFKTLDDKDPRVIEGVWPPIGKWQGEKGEAPPVTQNINLLMLVIDQETRMAQGNFIVHTFSKTSFSVGRKLYSAIDSHKMQGLFPWQRTYWLWNKVETNDANQTFGVTQFAKGALLKHPERGAPGLEPLAAAMAMSLADKEEGRVRQEAIINAAHIDEGDGEATTVNASEADGVFGDDDSEF